MQVAVTLVMMDIVGSRRIQQAYRALVGDRADQEYHEKVHNPCWEHIKSCFFAYGGKIHDNVGDQLAAYFDHANDALTSVVELQRKMQKSPIPLPKKSGSACLELRTAIGIGTMGGAPYHRPGTLPVGTFSDLARILAVVQPSQVLVTQDWQQQAGKLAGATFYPWPDLVLPKENESTTVVELLWDDRRPRRPKQPDMRVNARVFDILLADFIRPADPLNNLQLFVNWNSSWRDCCTQEPEVSADVYELKGKYITVIIATYSWDIKKITQGSDEGEFYGQDRLACLGPFKSVRRAKLAGEQWQGEVSLRITIDNYTDKQTHQLLGVVPPKHQKKRRTNG